MPHISVPAAELNTRLDRLRCAMTEKDPAWSMLLLDNTLDMYYFTGTMQDGALVVTPDQATLFVRRSFDVAKDESAFADIRPMGSFRGIKEVYPYIPETVYVAAKTMTLQKLSMLNKPLPFAPKPMDGVLSALRSVKSAYELDCMRESGRLHRYVIEGLAPAFLREGVSEARLCSEICTAIVDRGGMGISRYNQAAAEDVLGIADIAAHVMHAWRESALNKTRGVRITVSTSWFVPKPHTAFQWEPQIPIEEYERRVKLLREAMNTKSVTYNWHPSPTSFMEAVISCGDRRLGKVIETAWRKGETLSAWEDYFDLNRWMEAFEECGLDPHFYANRRRSEDEILPWSMISCGVAPGYLKREHALSYEGVTTPDCRTHCNACGANCLVGGKCDV